MHLVTPIPLDLIVFAAPRHWAEQNLARNGPLQNDMVETIMQMTNKPEDYVRMVMPPRLSPDES